MKRSFWTLIDIQVTVWCSTCNQKRLKCNFHISAHICATFLICGLLKEMKSSINTIQTHIAASLFLISVETYLRITDVWWTEGRLEDWRNEYFVER